MRHRPGASSYSSKSGLRNATDAAGLIESSVVFGLFSTSESVELEQAPANATPMAVDEALKLEAHTPTHVYLQVVRSFLRHHWDASAVDIAEIGSALRARGLDVHPASGMLVAEALAA